MADNNNNDDNGDVLRCQATTTSASRYDNLPAIKSCIDATTVYDDARLRHGDVTLTSLIRDESDEMKRSNNSRRAVIRYGHETTEGHHPIIITIIMINTTALRP